MQWWGSSENVCHNRNPRGHLVNLFDEGDPYFEEMSKEGVFWGTMGKIKTTP